MMIDFETSQGIVSLPFEEDELPHDTDGNIDRKTLKETYDSVSLYDKQSIYYPFSFHPTYPKVILCSSDVDEKANDEALGTMIVGEKGEYRIWWNEDDIPLFYPLGIIDVTSNYIILTPSTKTLISKLKARKQKYIEIDATLNAWYKKKDIRFSLSSSRMTLSGQKTADYN